MAQVTWCDKYAVGVQEIDGEHKELFDAVGAFELAMTRNTEAAEIRALLRNLTASTVAHFAHEEAMMREAKYPGLTLHCADHRHLMEKLDAFTLRFTRGGAAITRHSIGFLRDWLLHHIENDDRRFADWLKAHEPDLAREQQQMQTVGRGA